MFVEMGAVWNRRHSRHLRSMSYSRANANPPWVVNAASAIAQAGANAQASLNGLSGGNADFSGLSQSINQLTGQLASGNLESALSMFNGIAASMPAVPAGSPGGRRP